jgi:1,6-anhydro-N-acetylmuramate kinase
MPEQTEYGMWIAGPSFDFVFFEQETARVHQDHIIMHELAHMLLGHKTATISEELQAELLEHKTFSVISHTPEAAEVLRRSMVELHERLRESEAEALATFIQNKLILRVGIEALTKHVATAPFWSEAAPKIGFD